MKERPILMQSDNVKAILEDRKTQTRRIVKKAIHEFKSSEGLFREIAGAVLPALESGWVAWYPGNSEGLADFTKLQYKTGFLCPYGQVGSRLWLRETWYQDISGGLVCYKADYPVGDKDWPPSNTAGKIKPSIFMPRWASRITLEITAVRVERLQEITYLDARAEGILTFDRDNPDPTNGGMGYNRGKAGLPMRYESTAAFMDLWDSLNAKRGYGWDFNPWVWVIEFKRIDK